MPEDDFDIADRLQDELVQLHMRKGEIEAESGLRDEDREQRLASLSPDIAIKDAQLERLQRRLQTPG